MDYIKRLIGLPNETVEFRDNQLYINGEIVEEDYLPDNVYTSDFGPIVLPSNPSYPINRPVNKLTFPDQ